MTVRYYETPNKSIEQIVSDLNFRVKNNIDLIPNLSFIKPHSHPSDFYWGCQCSWTPPQPTAYRSPMCSLTTI